jgi:hypothetical protein
MKGIYQAKSLLTLTMLVLSLLVVRPGSAIAAPILDQNYDASIGGDSSLAIYGGQSLAQTFTVGLDGYLDSVGLMLNRHTPNTYGSFTLNLFSTTLGSPNDLGTLFFSQTYSVNDLAGEGLFSYIYSDFDTSSANIKVAAGDVLAMSVSHEGGNDNWLVWDGKGNNPYAAGQSFYKNGISGNQWQGDTAQHQKDLGFRTFVDTTRTVGPVTVSEPSHLALIALALFGLARLRRA